MIHKYRFALMALCLTLISSLLTSCDNNIPQPDEKLKGNTVIVYMGAENDLYPISYRDMEEMKLAIGDIPSNCQVVVFQDAEQEPTIFHLTHKGLTIWKEYTTDLNSGAPATMKGILQEIIKGFPSEKYSLVLWSHGSGWINDQSRAIILDNQKNSWSQTGSWINISDLNDILSTLPHMEYIMFDACYMQSIEVAAELYTHTDYIIGSPTEIPGEGAPYNIIMDALCKADIPGIIDGYASEYQIGYGVLLSAVSCADFPEFCAETAKYIGQAFDRNDMPKTAGIQIYAPDYGTAYTKQSDMPVPYDMRSAMYRVLNDEDYTAWEALWRKTILYPTKANIWATRYSSSSYGNFHCTMHDPEHYGGISMNIPDAKYDAKGWNTEFKQTAWYRLANWELAGW